MRSTVGDEFSMIPRGHYSAFDARKQMDTFQQTIEKLCVEPYLNARFNVLGGITVIVTIVVDHVIVN